MIVLDYLKRQWPEVTITSHHERVWNSRSFSGTRLNVNLTAPLSSSLLDEITEHEFILPHLLVVDLNILEVLLCAQRITATIDILLLDT